MIFDSQALFIGRFQPFHNGHLDALKNILEECEKVTILIGSSQASKTKKNPWSGKERKEILEKLFENDERVSVKLLPDKNNDKRWIESLLKTEPNLSMVYSGNDWVLSLCMEYGIPCEEIKYNINISATEVREKIKKGENIWGDVPEVIGNWVKSC